MEAFYHITDSVRAVGDGDTLDLGAGKVLHSFDVPNVHWPETMVTFEESTGVLFSCDAFGSFGAFKGTIFADEIPKRIKNSSSMKLYDIMQTLFQDLLLL